ncbi:MAG: DNRLRE domain-containing protein, partial [Solirubrobacteraceae bacterium]
MSAQASAAPAGAGVGVGREIPGLRTTTSDTFAVGRGQLLTRVFPFAVNYRTPGGRLAAIDDRLIADRHGGYRNRANSFGVDVPGSLGAGPVRFSTGRAWLAFSLEGGRGAGRVSGDSERFARAMPGVAVAYTVGTTGLTEQVTLSGRSAPTSLRYMLRASHGLAPRTLKGGATAFVDSAGRRVFVLPAELMWSSRRPEVREVVAGSLRAVRGGWRLTLTPAPSFVSRVLRSGASVVIDPSVFPGTVTPPPSDGDCELDAQTPTTANCGNTIDSVDNNGADVDHIAWHYNVAGSVPRNAEVLSADLGATVASNDNTTSQQVGLYQVTQNWTQSATWNTYDGTHAWATAGGDTASSPSDTTSIAPSDTAAAWHPRALVQGWVDGTIANDGLILEAMGSSLQADLSFYSNATSNGSRAPSLSIRYEPRLGAYRGYTLDSQTLTDRSSLGVNVADGNLLISNQDLQVAGTAGDDLVMGRYYNNLDSIQGAFGRGWTMTPGADTALDIAANGLSVFYRADSGAVKTFAWNGSAWTAPAGLDAVLTQTSSTTWTLHFNNSGVTQHFTGPGGNNTAALLTSVVDRNNNTISYAYNASNQLQTITDTQGRQTTVQYNAAGYVSQITDSSGRVYKYFQDANGNLTSYVDPANHTTVYGYDSHGDLTQITTPAGSITKFGYANAGSGDYRVTSVTRLVKPTDLTGPTRSYTYYTGGSPCTSSDEGRTVESNERGYATTYCYAPSGDVTQTADPDGHAHATSFTADANVATLTNPMGGTLTLGYQNSGTTSERLTSIQQGTSGPKTTLVYNDPNNAYSPSQVTDPENRSVSYAYDTPGNAHTITDQLTSQNQVTLDHNLDGTIADSIDARANKTTYHYTAGNLTEIDPPDLTHLGKTTISYDSLSRPVKIIDGKGQERDIAYDVFDRATSVTYKDAGGAVVSTITYTYDNDGNLTKRAQGAPATAYVGKIASATGPSGGTTATLAVGANGVKAGDAIILTVHTSNATAAPSATDSAGNTYHIDKGPILDTGGDATTILSAQNVTALSSGQH